MRCNHLSTLSKELCWSFRCAVWSVCISETGECHLFGERLLYSWKQEKNMVLLCGVMPSWPSCNHYAPRFMSRPAEALSSSGIRLKCLNTQKTVFCIIQCLVSNHSTWNSSSFTVRFGSLDCIDSCNMLQTPCENASATQPLPQGYNVCVCVRAPFPFAVPTV